MSTSFYFGIGQSHRLKLLIRKLLSMRLTENQLLATCSLFYWPIVIHL